MVDGDCGRSMGRTDSGAVPERRRGAPGVIAPPPAIFLIALAVGFGLDVALGFGSLPVLVAATVGGALIIAGTALLGSFVRAFRRAGTPVDPYAPTRAIVTCGPYRLTRNPGYLGMALTYAGIAVASGALWAFVPLVVAIAIIDRGVIAREERYLEREFGDSYLMYKARVRRWL